MSYQNRESDALAKVIVAGVCIVISGLYHHFATNSKDMKNIQIKDKEEKFGFLVRVLEENAIVIGNMIIISIQMLEQFETSHLCGMENSEMENFLIRSKKAAFVILLSIMTIFLVGIIFLNVRL